MTSRLGIEGLVGQFFRYRPVSKNRLSITLLKADSWWEAFWLTHYFSIITETGLHKFATFRKPSATPHSGRLSTPPDTAV